MEVSYIEIAKLELQRADILVLRVPPDWTHDQQENAHRAVTNAMRQADVKAPVIIGTTDVEFQIIRKDAA